MTRNYRIDIPAGKLKLSEVPEMPWIHLIVDFITKLPLVAGKDVILVVCDRLSKIMYFVATIEGTLAEGLSRLFKDNVWKLHGLPESVVSSSQMVDLGFLYFIFYFYFYFYFDLFFYFLFLEQLGLGLISHAVTSVTI